MNWTPEQLKIWRAGIKHGMREYAWWKDGVEYVGTTGKTLKQAWAEVDAGEYDQFIEQELKKI